ncbi:hypothetical protein Tsubulata_043636 [Turnera subulata]|uniref:Uncharacterized protein n=1 Tax=Turnera subulata TaxID=218843 RepID=A0A9Q0JFD0_9ROSI|nr:hypothetical protein Tsubulata_043636 [Turnera subulata]
MTFDVGAVLEDEEWQAPAHCFASELEDHDAHNSGLLQNSASPTQTLLDGVFAKGSTGVSM